ncbi:MAG TPA: asparaginase domain-containing protein [bacterium]|nr:asparaginase domain-containing protein [bacterium]
MSKKSTIQHETLASATDGSVSVKWFLDKNGNIPSGFDENGTFDPYSFDPGAPYAPKGRLYRLQSNPTQDLEDPFDLDNLRFINKDFVLRAHEQIEHLAATTKKELVCMIATGGTIAMHTNAEGKLVPGISPQYLLQFAGGNLESRFGIVSFSLPTLIDSSQMEIDYIADVVIAMSWFYENLSKEARNRFCGFFVTHGTDTLAFSSTYAHVMLGSNCPFSVGFVAAQKTTESRFTDVGVNFTYCLNMLAELRISRKAAVFLSIGGTSGGAFIPAASLKVSDTDVNAFASPGRHKMMDSSDFLSKGIDLDFVNKNTTSMTVDDVYQPVVLRGFVPLTTLHARVGVDPRKLYDYVKQIRELAIVLVTYGAFTFSRKQINAIVKAAKETDTILMAVNPFPSGSTDHHYADSMYIKEQGIIPIHSLEHAVYAKVKWAQAVFGNDFRKIRFFLTGTNFVGEQPNEWTPPLDIIEENMRLGGYRVRTYGQPRESLDKVSENIEE